MVGQRVRSPKGRSSRPLEKSAPQRRLPTSLCALLSTSSASVRMIRSNAKGSFTGSTSRPDGTPLTVRVRARLQGTGRRIVMVGRWISSMRTRLRLRRRRHSPGSQTRCARAMTEHDWPPHWKSAHPGHQAIAPILRAANSRWIGAS